MGDVTAEGRALAIVFEAWVFLTGICVGSFLNVVIARLPADESVVKPRSRCPRCGRAIEWYDNLPVISWLVLRGRCRHCALPISPRYPVVELLVGLLALALARRFGTDVRVFTYGVFAALLVAIAYIDLDHWWIPDELSFTGIVTGLLAAGLNPDLTFLDSVVGAAAGFALFALIAFVGRRVFQREAMGEGDWFLIAMIGAYLGWKALLPVIVLSSLQASVIGGLLLIVGRNRGSAPTPQQPTPPPEPVSAPAAEGAPDAEEEWTPDPHAIPFGPFLVLAALEQLLLGDAISGLYERLMVYLML